MRSLVCAALLVMLGAASPVCAQDEPTLGVSTAPAADAADARSDGEEPEPAAQATAESDPASASEPATATTTEPEAATEPAPTEPESEAEPEAEPERHSEPTSESAPEPELEQQPEAEAEVEGAPAPAARWTEGRVIAWATFGVSFGVAVLGGVLLAVGVDDLNTIENAPDGTMWADVAGARDRAPILTGLGAVVLGLGAAGAAVGAGLLAYFGEGGTWLEVSALPGGLMLRGRF